MTKSILGLDLGTTSIGWAYLREDDTNPAHSEILRSGVRIIPLTTSEKDEFEKGQKQTKNTDRRLKRSMRRNLQRYKLRRKKLVAILEANEMMPETDLLCRMDRLEIYALRAKALREQITLAELGRIFYHLNQKRGYQSSRLAGDDEDSSDQGDNVKESKTQKKESYVEGIERRSAELEKKGKTIGEDIYEQLSANPHYRVKSSDDTKTVYLRENYKHEFNRIWDAQRAYYPMLTDELKHLIKDETIYYQRRLKSQKNLVSKCRYEPNLRGCPKSSPFHQIRRMWQDINHLRITDKHGEIIGALNPEKRDALFNALWIEADLKQKRILEIVGFKGGHLNFGQDETGDEKKSLRGFTTLVRLRKALTDTGISNPEHFLQFEYRNYTPDEDSKCQKDPIAEPLYALWHHLYSFDGTTKELKDSLKKKYDFNDAQVNALVKVNFERDYSALSAKATRKILPALRNGKIYSDACIEVYGKHADYVRSEEKWEPVDQLKSLKRNSLRNPAVEQILNHLINLVNDILADDTLGRPDEIHVELARELKQNADQRKNITKANADRESERKKIVTFLENHGIVRPSNADITRYKLWNEFGKYDIYDPLNSNPIEFSQLFSGEYDIDHIIPQSRLFDDSYNNKVITHRRFNREKGNQVAFDYMQSRSREEFEAYKRLIDQTKDLSRAKAVKLMMAQQDIPNDFIERQLRETAYITKEALRILKQVVTKPQNVISTSGSVTDFLRSQWGMNSILKRLNLERYRALGRVETNTNESGQSYEYIQDWSKRDDHRHHAVDAIVIAATSLSARQAIETLNQHFSHYANLKDGAPYFGPFWVEKRRVDVSINDEGCEVLSPNEKHLLGVFRNKAEASVASILISFKTGKRVGVKNENHFEFKHKPKLQSTLTPRGQLHKESIYGKIRVRERIVLSTRFNLDELENIIKPHIRALLEERLALFDNNPKKAFKDLSSKPIWYDKANNIPLTFVTVWRDQPVIRKGIGIGFTQTEKIVDKTIRELVQARLDQFGGNPKEAFKDLYNNPIWLNKEQGIAIRRVRIIDNQDGLVPLHIDKETGKPKDFVATGNNHHVAIYRDAEGVLSEEVVTFWDAFNRKRDGKDVINRNPEDGKEFLFSMQVNELFVLGLEDNDLDITDPNNYRQLSKYLYRVQSLSAGDYYFRHHLATTLEDKATLVRVKSFGKLTALNPTKVMVYPTNTVAILPNH